MHKTDGAGNVGGQFTNENLALGLAASEVPADWLNAVQAELLNVVAAGGLAPLKADTSQVQKAIAVLIANAVATRAPLNGAGATGTWGVNITGNAQSLGGYAQDFQTVVGNGDYLLVRNQSAGKISLASGASAAAIVQSGASGNWPITAANTIFQASQDGGRNPAAILPTANPRSVRYDFSTGANAGVNSRYAGVMTYTPYDGTTAVTGDASYQMAFGGTVSDGGGVPMLNIRKGIDSTWGSWYTLLHSGNVNSYGVARSEFRSFGTVTINPNGLDATCTTAQFIAHLTSLGFFGYATATGKCSWSYASNNDLTDTGFGTVELAGCVIETWVEGSSYKHVRLTRPTTGTGGFQVLVYNDQGPTYAPGWRAIISNENVAAFAPTLTGGGASGNWNINASSATFLNSGQSATDVVNITGRINSGFYQCNGATAANGWPIALAGWAHLWANTHANTGNYFSSQFATGFYSNRLFHRSTSGNGSGPWDEIYTTSNISTVMPVGARLFWHSSSAPAGFLICDGSAVSRTAYASLFAAIGAMFGGGDGSSTFNLPDHRNRTHMGAGSTYGSGAVGGSADAVVVSHTHSVYDPGHSHSYTNLRQVGGTSSGPDANWWSATTQSTGANATGISIYAAGQSGAGANLPPFIASHVIIKY